MTTRLLTRDELTDATRILDLKFSQLTGGTDAWSRMTPDTRKAANTIGRSIQLLLSELNERFPQYCLCGCGMEMLWSARGVGLFRQGHDAKAKSTLLHVHAGKSALNNIPLILASRRDAVAWAQQEPFATLLANRAALEEEQESVGL